MRSRLVTAADRPALRRRIQRLHQVAWPPFLRDGAVNALWPRLYTDFPASTTGGAAMATRPRP